MTTNKPHQHLRPAATPAGKSLPTLAAVNKYADKLRSEALALTERDIYAKPWYPTTSVTLRLVQRCTKARRDNALAAGLTPEQVTEAELHGPSDALAIMAGKYMNSIAEHREEQIQEEHRTKRHVRRQKQAKRDREAQLVGMTAGQRIDNAIAALSMISTVKAQAMDPDKIRGGVPSGEIPDNATGGPIGPGDPASRARMIAAKAVREIEDEYDDATRRRVELEAA